MSERSYRLLPQEEIIYEGPSVVLTSQRLMANLGASNDGSFDEALLTDLGAPKKYNGGKYGHMSRGVGLLAAGAAVLAVEILIYTAVGLSDTIEAALFLVGSLGVAVGLYLIIGAVFQVKPNTTVVFPKMGGGQIVVPFTDWDSPEAEELSRQFAKAKRGF